MILEVLQSKPYTVALATSDTGHTIHAIGLAKWNESDKGKPGLDWDELRGAKIAVMRCALHYHESKLRILVGGSQTDPKFSRLEKYTKEIGDLWDSLGFDNEALEDGWERLIKDVINRNLPKR